LIIELDFSSVRTPPGASTRRAVTPYAELIGDKFGLGVGGLFLAFPSSPASASLIEKHQREKKRRAGMNGEQRIELPFRLAHLALCEQHEADLIS
jgi:hypothetical protein